MPNGTSPLGASRVVVDSERVEVCRPLVGMVGKILGVEAAEEEVVVAVVVEVVAGVVTM